MNAFAKERRAFFQPRPPGGKREDRITKQRTRIEWASFIRNLLNERYPDAKKVVLVMDNLNTHDAGSLYAGFPAEEARRLSQRLEIRRLPSLELVEHFGNGTHLLIRGDGLSLNNARRWGYKGNMGVVSQAAGSSKVKTLPLPGWLRTLIRPS